MQAVLAILRAAVAVVFALFGAVILGTFFGGVVGWVVGLVFDAPSQVAVLIGMPELTPFGVGALLGFVGGFLKTSVSTS